MQTAEHCLVYLLELLPRVPTAKMKLDSLELVQTTEKQRLRLVTVTDMGVAT